MSRLSVLTFTLLLFLFPRALAAQQTAITNEPTPPAIEKKAFDLLETVASRISTLRYPENRIAVSCAIADLVWSKDEKRARALFENVSREEAALVASVDLSDQRAYELISPINSQRQEVINRMALHDPDMALAFLRATRFPADAPMYSSNWERNLELSLSRAIAAKDPERALKIARESLSKGLTYELISLLAELERKNKPAAQSLYESVINRIKDEDLSRNQEAANIAINLLTSFQPPLANEDLFRDLLETVIKSALSMTPADPLTQQTAQNYFGSLFSSMQLVEKYAPARARAVRDWSQAITRTLDPHNQMYSELNQTVQNGSVDDVLALAPKFPSEMRNQVYQQAAWKASSDGDIARARQIAADYISDPVQRRQFLEQINNQQTWTAINDNKLAEARALLAKSSSVELRVQVLCRIAATLMAKDNKKEALDCLNEARALVSALPRNSTKVWQQMQLASAYATVELDQSFALMQAIVIQLNELVMAAVVMDGFENRYLRRGEWMMNGPNNMANIVTNMRHTIAQLARFDLDRAETLSDQLERPEIRLMTQLEIVQSTLTGASMGPMMGQPRNFIGGLVR
ncbi:MAG TPA: hypothetical protein VE135_02430 [Pyrinomonadaceae bacterium]|nr:hypothetical protein [Pyrinomonadaceae bacterium]